MKRRGFLLAGALSGISCGYKVAGKADLVPKDVVTIGIPPFRNVSTRYRLTERLPIAITREFISRTKYQILPDSNGADAVLEGAINNVFATPTVYDPTTGRAAGVQVQASLSVVFRHAKTGKVLYTNPSMDFRQRYEISSDPAVYFDESTSAFDRMCRDVAAAVVTAILENF
ncbi:LPS assembly lipoprotein LptE [Bryobacter aggregatus]|uniref:LPS assembly lipoprotein LptE n=1 Tax=Bryobacter aggregatus TaxID=360054 RepID=UPI0004E135B1|nr:LPS assembly lipoprotein LptE [Bryobacter aggregatus]